MRKKLLKLAAPLVLLAACLTGPLAPQKAEAAGGVCRYYCLDPQLTCCITCYRMGSSCVCPDHCTFEIDRL